MIILILEDKINEIAKMIYIYVFYMINNSSIKIMVLNKNFSKFLNKF